MQFKKYRFLTLLLLLSPILSLGQSGSYFSLSDKGGVYDEGAIFRLDSSISNFTETSSFYFTNFGGYYQRNMVRTDSNVFYGISAFGGRRKGNIFKYDANHSTYSNLYNFGDDNNSSAYFPLGSLLKANNGKLYGMTNKGGLYDFGTLFEYDLNSNSYTDLFHFNDTIGKSPSSSLVQHPNGKLYGITRSGGAQNSGVLFEFDITSSNMLKKVDLANYGISLFFPDNELTLTSTGKLFGLGTQSRIVNGMPQTGGRAIFEYDIAADSILVHYNNLDDTTRTPANSISLYQGKMVEDSMGMLYGFDASRPRIFRFNPNTLWVDTAFALGSGSILGRPINNIEIGTNGMIYGISRGQGLNNEGTVFSFNPSTYTSTVLYQNAASKTPTKLSITDNNKLLFSNNNEVIEINPTNSNATVKLDAEKSADGHLPQGELIAASNGKLYGATKFGGAQNKGVLFEYDPLTDNRTTLVNFNSLPNFGNMFNNPVEGASGKLYGTAYNNVNSDFIYEYDYVLDTIFIKSFLPAGYNFKTNFIKHPNGKMYGTAATPNRQNCMYEYDLFANTITILQQCFFTNTSFELASLLNHTNGNIYFITQNSGLYFQGNLFEFNPNTNILTNKHDFQFSTAFSNEVGKELIELNNNKLLCYSIYGGSALQGVFYEYDLILDTLIEVYDFAAAAVQHPVYLKQLNNGKIVGYTKSDIHSAQRAFGKLFEYNPTSRTVSEKFPFSRNEANMGPITDLSPIPTNLVQSEQILGKVLVGPNPTNNSIFIKLPSAQRAAILQLFLHSKLEEHRFHFANFLD